MDDFPQATAADLFQAVVTQHSDCRDPEQRRGFGSGALKVNGKIFCGLEGWAHAAQTPAVRVDALIVSLEAERFSTGPNREKREWVLVQSSMPERWIALSDEAKAFVSRRS